MSPSALRMCMSYIEALGSVCLFLKKVDSIFTLKINNSISVRNQLTLLLAKVDMFPEMVDSFPEISLNLARFTSFTTPFSL